ncbi:hypothetical protein [Yoonia sp. SDW83-1]|uniref:hypothetical protein n=1 Tax=Yoonia sp. SDW83-1 TaxID=3366945 RepID=UPI00398C726D
MTTKKTNGPSDEDTTRRAFLPIQMDLVERLTREAENRTGHAPCAISGKSGDSNKLAA